MHVVVFLPSSTPMSEIFAGVPLWLILGCIHVLVGFVLRFWIEEAESVRARETVTTFLSGLFSTSLLLTCVFAAFWPIWGPGYWFLERHPNYPGIAWARKARSDRELAEAQAEIRKHYPRFFAILLIAAISMALMMN